MHEIWEKLTFRPNLCYGSLSRKIVYKKMHLRGVKLVERGSQNQFYLW
jgi:hypothetical protein